jgi:hypothetical protein
MFFVGGFPLKEASEIFSQDNKGIIIWIYIVIVLIFHLFLLTIFGNNSTTSMHIPSGTLQVVSKLFPEHIFLIFF